MNNLQVVDILNQEHKLHSYYNPERFLSSNERGILRNIYSQRVILVPEDFVVAFQVALEEEVGDAAAEIMYRCGYEWGKEDIKNFVARLESEYEKPLKSFKAGVLLELWWWPFQASGWGSWKYDLSNEKEGLIFIDLFDSAVAQSIGNVGKVACHYYAGMFAAAFSHLSRNELSGIEIQCYAMGEEFCKFLIGSSKRINSAQFWVREGATANEVIDRL